MIMIKNKIKCKIKKYLVIICAFTIFFSFEPLSLNAQTEEKDDTMIMVSLGDSYSSGEGIEKFYGQDIKKRSNQYPG